MLKFNDAFTALSRRFAFPKSRFALQAAILLTLGDKSGSARALGASGPPLEIHFENWLNFASTQLGLIDECGFTYSFNASE